MAETVKTCSSCGNELPPAAVACPACGAELGKSKTPEMKGRESLRGRLGCLTVLILLGIAAILAAATLISPKQIWQKDHVAQARAQGMGRSTD